jgi:hypothetical protein
MMRVREYPEGRLAIFHGPQHRVADYDAAGNLCNVGIRWLGMQGSQPAPMLANSSALLIIDKGQLLR